MPPVTRSSHSRIAPAPLQQTFPNRRKAVRPAKATPSLPKRQSTLTQIDYVTPPSGQREAAVSFSDADDDDDDYEEQHPRKKRKANARQGSTKRNVGGKKQNITGRASRSQSTLTQKWSGRPSIPLASDSEDDDDVALLEADVLDGNTSRQNVESPGVSWQDAFARRSPKRGLASQRHREASTRPTTSNSATRPSTPADAPEAVIPSSQTSASVHASMGIGVYTKAQQPSPLRERSANVGSPKGSQSTDHVEHRNVDDESRSRRLSSTARDNETQVMGTWMANLIMTPKKPRPAERRGFVRTTTIQDSEEEESAFEISPVSKKAGVETLDFAKQIPSADAQPVDDVQQPAEEVSRTGEALPAVDTGVESATAVPPPEDPLWKRTGLVADSEEGSMELDALELPDNERQVTADTTDGGLVQELEIQDVPDANYEADNEHAETFTDVEGITSDFDYEDVYPQTYDPVSAALDRDAARFGMTETQLDAQQSNDAGDDDYDEDDLDTGVDHRHDHGAGTRIEVVPSSQPLEKKVPSSPELGVADSTHGETKQGAVHHPGDVDDSGYGSQASVIPSSQPDAVNGRASQEPLAWSQPPRDQPSKADDRVDPKHQQATKASSKLMQPPEREQQGLSAPLRPSQVSTIGDTQPSRPNSAHGLPLTFATPEKSARTWELSSSPLPMPPESWCSGVDNIDDQQMSSDGLADFSLPPPPPLLLSSSMRQSGGDD